MDTSKAFMLGQWKVEPELNKLSCGEHEVILVPKVMAVLLVLVESGGEPLNLKTLMKKVWKEQVVSDSSVYQAIAQLRKALGDTAAKPAYIQRVSGKGYRLIAEVNFIDVKLDCDKKDSDDSASLSSADAELNPKMQRPWYWQIAASCMVIFIVLLSGQWLLDSQQPSKTLEIAQIKSISLQHLDTTGLDEANSLVALNDVLLTQLMQIKKLRVVSLGQAPSNATTQAIITGRIDKKADNIRVFLQLLDVESQDVILAKVFDGNTNDLFFLQNAIAEWLLAVFEQSSTSSIFKQDAIDRKTFDQYLLGRHLWQQRNSEALNRAKDVFEEMQRQGQLFPLAAVGLCDTYHSLNIYSDWSLQQALDKCRPLLEQALSKEPELGQALAAQAFLLSRQGKKQQASELFKQAIKNAPNYPFSYVWHAEQNRRMGKYEQGLSMTQTAYELAPMSPTVNRSLAYAYLNAGNKKQARFYYRRALSLQFDYTDRAIEELDFLPITIERARAFLKWVEQNSSLMEKRHSYQLTQALIHLAVGDHAAVANTLEKLAGQQVNLSFKLFIEMSLASAQGRYQDVIELIEKRMALHQDAQRYVGAYLMALEQFGDAEKVYQAFLRLRPELADKLLHQEKFGDVDIGDDNAYLIAYFVQLQAKRGKFESVSALAQLLDRTFTQGYLLQDIYYARWLLFRGHKERAQTLILRLMHDGWLPDYNAQLYPETIMLQLFIDAGLKRDDYQKLLDNNRAKVLAELN
ncbi:winged helix-turn-helix domain-containing protein [Psychrobium sp. MM17-31]|uniref:winged helix-turn-helix domain-containing protein n=1 Tax=Psychrobium sp. MM17-31 TaxID=2917758 RepID=UPI001EF65EE7|nr:winged helix-turn-helix domain-containing protein [Psychrobium sp. MM17-31]MCG7530401.1 winged helix-turn-helix domain-containing protein [Psychrobium sp. MM17-31]